MDSLRRLALMLSAVSGSSLRADTAADERLLRAANIPTDGAALVAWLRQATPKHVDPEMIGTLVDKLGSDDFAERERAVRDLMTLGARAAPHLRQALSRGDRELALRAQGCLRTIDDGAGPRVQAAVIRLLAARK